MRTHGDEYSLGEEWVRSFDNLVVLSSSSCRVDEAFD